VLTRAQKEEAVTSLRDKFGRATSVFVADYRGLSVQQVDDLRSRLRKDVGDCEYHVVKNTLLRRATTGLGAEALVPHFKGPTAVAFCFGEPVAVAKLLVRYAKDHEAFALKAGLVEGQAYGSRELATLATLPTLLELRGKLVGLLQTPAQRLAAVLQAPGAQLARVTDARRASLEQAGGGAV
jgi:large subunit ribosomal protein L10